MKAISRSKFSDGLIGVGSVCAVGLGLWLLDVRVREGIAELIHDRGASPHLAAATNQAHILMGDFMEAVRDQSIAHAPLAFFALIALLLFIVMLRT